MEDADEVEPVCYRCDHSAVERRAGEQRLMCGHPEVIAMNGNRPRMLAAVVLERACRGRWQRRGGERVQ